MDVDGVSFEKQGRFDCLGWLVAVKKKRKRKKGQGMDKGKRRERKGNENGFDSKMDNTQGTSCVPVCANKGEGKRRNKVKGKKSP